MAIKLFGKTIQMPSANEVLVMHREAGREEDYDDDDKTTPPNKEDSHESIDPNISDEEMSDEPSSSATNEEKNNQDDIQNQKPNVSIDKSVEKSEIILPCPRCKSKNTKFCYFNNYNIKQPRHFCKNCQRYWTAGGSIRNVPVGAGRRRKSKSFAVYHHIRVPDCAIDVLRQSIHHSCPPKPTGTLLSFGADAPICQSMTSVLDLVEKKRVKKKPANETNKADNSNLFGLHRCLYGSNWVNPWSHIPFYPISPYWGTQHH